MTGAIRSLLDRAADYFFGPARQDVEPGWDHLAPPLAEGQVWRMRNGQTAPVIAGRDRSDTYRWVSACSTYSWDADGRIARHHDSDHDLIELLYSPAPL